MIAEKYIKENLIVVHPQGDVVYSTSSTSDNTGTSDIAGSSGY